MNERLGRRANELRQDFDELSAKTRFQEIFSDDSMTLTTFSEYPTECDDLRRSI